MSGLYPVHIACKLGSREDVEDLLSRGHDVNERDNWGKTPLHYASTRGALPIVKYLLSKGADPNLRDRKGWTALHFAAYNNRIEILDFLLKKGVAVDIRDNNNPTAFYVAVNNGKADAMKVLLQWNCSFEDTNEACSPIHSAIRKRNRLIPFFLWHCNRQDIALIRERMLLIARDKNKLLLLKLIGERPSSQ